MKLELSKDDANSLGAILVALQHAKLYNKDGLAISGGEVITFYQHYSKVFELRNRIMDADQGGVKTGKPVDTKEENKKGKGKK